MLFVPVIDSVNRLFVLNIEKEVVFHDITGYLYIEKRN